MVDLRSVLKRLVNGEISLDDAERMIKLFAVSDLGRVVLFDLGRELRRGIPEIVYGEGKDLSTLLRIAREVTPKAGKVLISRVSSEHFDALVAELGREFVVNAYKGSRLVVVKSRDVVEERLKCRVSVVTAGSADVPVAEEVEVVLREAGCDVKSIYDVGVAGLQRVIEAAKAVKEFDADVAVVIAGREGALPSVISSLLDVPVIAVPTSHSYGFGGLGISALMSMLQSCSLGIAVVNIDNGVGAGSFAALICRRINALRERCG
ncbi:MAG: nickel pincer cofactor biosynthesis protein LarB [Sulfolobales archaeon]|nr:nickel pincer cofactor biosynthesis protein LarB [Sulfolobales archaeon]MCX8186948.1 nickel pincer cofactor biosynthesis protein LarB [Sulfolobales archaeon]MDW7970203.1 nickel pincer cofactor biosynthesis protein LarB [Sulfolobales archaeon]